jgi:hypothetical protein
MRMSIAFAIVAVCAVSAVPHERALAQSSGAARTSCTERYRKTRDYKCLRALVKRLRLGMPQSGVEALLGEPDYSPIEGQYYYSSNRRAANGETIGLVVEYRRIDARRDPMEMTQTGKLEWFEVMPIGE